MKGQRERKSIRTRARERERERARALFYSEFLIVLPPILPIVFFNIPPASSGPIVVASVAVLICRARHHALHLETLTPSFTPPPPPPPPLQSAG